MKRKNWLLTVGLAVAFGFGVPALHAASIIDEWASVKVPPAPELKPVNVDNKTYAILVIDMVKETCNEKVRPRCVDTISAVEKFSTKRGSRAWPSYIRSAPRETTS